MCPTIKKTALIISMIVVAIAAMTCASKTGDRNQGESTMVAKKIEAVQRTHQGIDVPARRGRHGSRPLR